ncbi:uncharacterized protein YjbI with pentapeptide repeats [Streptomyces zagrosensis]|uniref:Uncharacterized protein YjbI with pentapeptide repeats n=1 Tax=Streptomyces zagrosensis TaxID=1042984 RepID=A0A7W9Q6X1_9ACTN|nr:pentapeptide repeat-containing protein [Streptomyces zagrosensis]MBB5934273.1 uncharacterized protein YjbI with pentapeptide repeats [Streptomyces zagrosensis]
MFEGDVTFDGASFDGASFTNSVFTGKSSFINPRFTSYGNFSGARFDGAVNFDGGQYKGPMLFSQATFLGDATFRNLTFPMGSWFSRIRADKSISFRNCKLHGNFWCEESEIAGSTYFADCSLGPASLAGATFTGEVTFERVSFTDDCSFERSHINPSSVFGSIVCEGTLNLTSATVTSSTVMDISAAEIRLNDAILQETFTLRARYADIDLTRARLFFPCTITTDYVPSERPDEAHLRELAFLAATTNQPMHHWGHDPTTASIVSLRGVDASFLLLSDVDLIRCEFAGAHHLDQLRLEGYWRLGEAPIVDKWHGILPYTPARRLVIEEERKWRSLRSRGVYDKWGWGRRPGRELDVPGLATLTTVYRQLRKAREDAKDEPGAADFYYGEMEMRRHSHKWSRAERWLLQIYWLLSGYGLRASRALAWLIASVLATILLMMSFGLPQATPKQEATGIVPATGGPVSFELEKEAPRNPTGDRFTTDRFEKSLNVTLNSVAFRSSGQDLTTSGGYIEMASRLFEPILLGLAMFAIRGRVKR